MTYQEQRKKDRQKFISLEDGETQGKFQLNIIKREIEIGDLQDIM